MSADAQPRRTRPNNAPSYYLGRPASVWLTVTTGRMPARDPGRQAIRPSIVPRVSSAV